MRRIPLVLVSLLAVLPLLVAADPLYKWVDDQGNVHYSDKPHPGAQKLVLPKANTYTAPDVVMPAPVTDGNDKSQANGHQPYSQIAVSSPKDQDTVWNTTTVSVSVSLTPALQPGDTLTISVDGKSQVASGTSATFTALERGEHAVTVTVHGLNTLTAQSIFYIQRGTRKKPSL